MSGPTPPEPPLVDNSAAPESPPPTEDSADPVSAEALSSDAADASDDGSDVPAASAEDEAVAATVITIIQNVFKQLGIPTAGDDGATPMTPMGMFMQALWVASRQNNEHLAAQLAAIGAVVESVGEAALAELSRSIGWIPGVGTVMYATSSLFNLGALGAAVLRGDQNDIVDEIDDLGRDLVGMIPVVGAPIAGTLYGGVTSSFGAAALSTPAPMAGAAVAAVTIAAAPAPGTPEWYFQGSLARALKRLLGWPATPRNFVDITNYLTDRTLDSANDQLEGLAAIGPLGSPARWLSGLGNIANAVFFFPSATGATFTDSLNAMGDWLNRVVPPFRIADGAGTLSVITPYKIMGAAVVGAATVLTSMLNGVYDPVQIEIDVIKATTGADVTAADLTNFTSLSAKVVLGILGDGGAFMHPERALNITLPTWTAAQVNPFTIVTYVVFVGLYKRFQEMTALTTFTTSTTYDSWHYTNLLGMYAAGTFHAVDPDGGTVVFPAGGALGATYTSAGKALVTVNTTDGGFTYTPPSILGPNAQNAAFLHRSTSENEADRYDTVQIPVTSADGVSYTLTFRIQIINGTNANPTGSAAVQGTDAAGVVRGRVTGSDSDGDTLTYSLVGSSVNGLTGNSAYTKNGSGNGGIVAINPTTGDFTYVSSATAGATQSFQVRIGDGHHGSTIVTVNVPNTTSITPVNVNTSTQNVVTGTVPGSTNKPGAFISYTLGAAPSKGSISSFNPTTGAFTYTRNAALGHSTPPNDVVTIIATDADGRQVTLRMNVTPTVPNAVPVVVSTTTDKGSTDTNKWRLDNAGGDNRAQTTTGRITATDADGDTLTYSLVNSSTLAPVTTTTDGGTVTFNADGSYTYKITKDKSYFHAAARIGATAAELSDTFTVAVNDGFGGVTYTTVTLATYAVNSTPVISGGGTPICAFGLCTVSAMTVSDPDGDSIPNSNVTPGAGAGRTVAAGSVTVWGSGTTALSWPAGGPVGTGRTANTFTVYDGYYTVTNGVINPGTPSKFWVQWAAGTSDRTTGN